MRWKVDDIELLRRGLNELRNAFIPSGVDSSRAFFNDFDSYQYENVAAYFEKEVSGNLDRFRLRHPKGCNLKLSVDNMVSVGKRFFNYELEGENGDCEEVNVPCSGVFVNGFSLSKDGEFSFNTVEIGNRTRLSTKDGDSFGIFPEKMGTKDFISLVANFGYSPSVILQKLFDRIDQDFECDINNPRDDVYVTKCREGYVVRKEILPKETIIPIFDYLNEFGLYNVGTDWSYSYPFGMKEAKNGHIYIYGYPHDDNSAIREITRYACDDYETLNAAKFLDYVYGKVYSNENLKNLKVFYDWKGLPVPKSSRKMTWQEEKQQKKNTEAYNNSSPETTKGPSRT